MNVVLGRLARCFLGSLKQWADIHVKTDIGKRRSDYFGTAIMAVLTQFDYQQARAAALLRGEALDFFANLGVAGIAFPMRALDATDRTHFGRMATVDDLKRI